MHYPSQVFLDYDIENPDKIELDVAKFVFEMDDSIISDPNVFSWMPSFSTDRQAAADVSLRMRGKPPAILKRFNELLKEWRDRCSATPDDIAAQVVMLTPEIICILAITACQECDGEGRPLDSDKDHHACP